MRQGYKVVFVLPKYEISFQGNISETWLFYV